MIEVCSQLNKNNILYVTYKFNSASQLKHCGSISVIHSSSHHHIDQFGVKVDSIVHKQRIQSSLHTYM